jgi:PAS domain-containing protein/predicted GNAT family acetyltransferase
MRGIPVRPSLLADRRDLLWVAAIGGTAAATLLAVSTGLLFGISTGIPHLLYIPVVLAAYRYPRRGTLVAGGIAGIYFLLVFLIAGSSQEILFEALVRAVVIVAIGWLIATLTRRLREQEDLYQGLFDHSEGGSILIADAGSSRIIEEVNWKAADLLRRKAADLRGTPAPSLWSGDDAEEFFCNLSRNGAVYAAETRFALPGDTSCNVLVSAAALPRGRAVLTFFDITNRVHAEQALKNANDKLSLLSRFSTDHLHTSVDRIIETVDEADARSSDPATNGCFERIRELAWNITRQLFVTESYKDLGTFPQVWIPVQRTLESTRIPMDDGQVSIRIWTTRLEVYADPLFSDVLTHLLENPVRYSNGTVRNVVVTCHEGPDGLDLIFRDDGAGVQADMKEKIFEYDAGRHAGIGLFICRQVAEVSGISIRETGTPGKGAQFVIRVPQGNYRFEGTGEDSPQLSVEPSPERFVVRHPTGATVKELLSLEFPAADALWTDYHNTTGDPKTDRIFAAFHEGKAVSLARCRRHPDGLEVDGVFTPASQRGHGYANAVVRGLVEACGQDDILYMHSVIGLEMFYGSYGFVSISEKELPPTIRDRFAWAGGEMEGANVDPMRRDAGPVSS